MRSPTRRLLQSARTEKDVENAYRAELVHHRPDAEVSSPFNTDGYLRWDTVRLLLEAKYDEALKDRVPVCNVLGQLLLYMKHFERAGMPLPNVLFVGDRNECFVLGASAVQGFLGLPLDWSVAPSSGSPELTRALVQGLNLLPYIYDVDENLKFREVVDKIEVLSKGEIHAVRASQSNLSAMFVYWQGRVFSDKTVTPVEQVDVFLRCLFQPGDVYLHPIKRGVLVVPGYPEGVIVNPDQYRSFFDHFQQGYKPSEIDLFYGLKDRLVEDVARRRQGAFFTPAIWVAEAHKTVSGVLGTDWRDKCIVWDPAAGTGNLTRDYAFKDLILSTAERPDVQVIKDQGYNSGAAVFQYDFLNPGVWSPFFEDDSQDKNLIPDDVDRRLREASAAGKRIVFLMNPPYGTAGAGAGLGANKTGSAQTVTNRKMKAGKLGASSQQLYAQFLFRCHQVAQEYGFKKYTIATFSIHTFLCSGSYRKFREWWYGRFAFDEGFLFNASHFADVSNRWGVAFTVWSEGILEPATTIPLMIKDMENFAVRDVRVKTVYNSDGREASKWVREPVRGITGTDAPQMSSGLVVAGKGSGIPALGALGFFATNSNSPAKSMQGVAFFAAGYTDGHGLSILPSNWFRCVALYSARKLVQETWVNQKDEYLVPDEVHPDYAAWVNDCHIYVLLHTSNNCTAMRQVPYKGNLWSIKNHWFWMTRQDALAAYDTPQTPALYRDCKGELARLQSPYTTGNNPDVPDGDPYFGHLLAMGQVTLSPDAQHVMELLKALWVKSLPLRESYAAGKPDLHLMTWDASNYQIKHLFRDLFPTEWKELQVAHKALAERLKVGVYKFGFLLP